MKDKTHAMNRGLSAEDAECGYSDAGKPALRRAYKNNQLKDASLLGNKNLMDFESAGDDKPDTEMGGFLPRNNYTDRY